MLYVKYTFSFFFTLTLLRNLHYNSHFGLEHARFSVIVKFLLMDLALKIEWHVLPC